MFFICILWGFDGLAGGVVVSIEQFRKDFGRPFAGDYVVDANWQLGFLAATLFGMQIPSPQHLKCHSLILLQAWSLVVSSLGSLSTDGVDNQRWLLHSLSVSLVSPCNMSLIPQPSSLVARS